VTGRNFRLKSQRFHMKIFYAIMVKQTLEVKRRLTEIALENIYCYSPIDFHTMIRVLHTTKILDPSFEPPVI